MTSTILRHVDGYYNVTKQLKTMILLLQAIAVAQAFLLLRCGDVEQNPGPGLHPGESIIAVAIIAILHN